MSVLPLWQRLLLSFLLAVATGGAGRAQARTAPSRLDGRYQGEVTHVTYPDGRQEYFGYNDAGELAWERKGSGAVITISGRDAQHRVTRIDYPDEGASFGFSATTTFDEFGRPVASTDRQGTTQRFFDLLDRPTQVLPPSPQAALTFSYTPDTTLQRWITTVTAAGVGSYVYKEDTKGRLADLVNPFSQTFHQEYDLDGKPTLTQFPSGLQEARTYTPRDWLASMQVKDANNTVLKTLEDFYTDAQGTYDPTGHLRREVENGSATHAFFYNPHYELTQETLPNATSILYGLDANGNRTSVTTNGVTDYYGVDAANKLLWVNRSSDPNLAPTPGQSNPYTIFGYDADGRVSSRDRFDTYGLRRILSLTWDSDDRLQQVTSGADSLLSASYNGAGERVSKTDFWTGAHNYSWGPGGILADSSGSTTYTPGFSQRQNGTDRFFHTDWLGSTRYLSDSGGGLPDTLGFDAFGNHTSASTSPYPSEFQFGATSGYQTEYASSTDPGVGLQLLGERYYDPVVGRFISPDPIGFAGGLNLYQYCGNDPVNCLDPDGEFVGALVALSVAIRVADVVALVYDSTELVRDLSMCGTPGWKTTLDGLAVGFDLTAFGDGTPAVAGVGLRTAEAVMVQASARALAREAAERAAFRATVGSMRRLDDGVRFAKARGGKQARLRALADDPKVPSRTRGWLKNEIRDVRNGKRPNIRNPFNGRNSPGRRLGERGQVLAHRRGFAAKDNFGYEYSDLQDPDLHDLQHRYEGR